MGIFEKYIILKEFGEYLGSSIDDIKFNNSGNCLIYDYVIDNESYQVRFCEHPISFYGDDFRVPSVEITNNAYEITFSSVSRGTRPTGKMNGTRVYGPLIKAIRKLIQEKNPEGLHFSGAYVEQDLMYHAFYERYLKNYYTRVAGADYLRNDFIESLKRTNDERWKIVEKRIKGINALLPDQYKSLVRTKEKKRRRYAKLLKAVGKIVRHGNDEPVYLSKVDPEEATIIAMHLTVLYVKPHIYHKMLTSFTPQQAVNLKPEITALQQFLDFKKGIKNVGMWVDNDPDEIVSRGWDHI
jgi:hypothetical protein